MKISNVSEDMLPDILCHLPVKSLFRFMCLSKPLCSMIRSEYFVKLHLRNYVHSTTKLSLILQNIRERTPNIFCFTFDLQRCGSGGECKEESEEGPFGYGTTIILGSCNGLLCVTKSDTTIWPGKHYIVPKVALWNPSTKKHHTLPRAPISVKNDINVRQGQNFNVQIKYAFGHDSINDDYKVLRIVLLQITVEAYLHITNISEVSVYSLKANSWRAIDHAVPSYLRGERLISCEYVLFHETFHWLSDPWYDLTKVVAFDIQRQEFCTVPVPNLPGNPREVSENVLCVLGLCLCLASTNFEYSSRHTDVWAMKEYGVKDSWVKLFSVILNTYDSRLLMPLAYSRDSDDDKVLVKVKKGFIWYDLKTATAKDVKVEIHPSFGAINPSSSHEYNFVTTLVSPFPDRWIR